MDQFLKENISQATRPTQDRLLLLTHKIDTLKVGSKAHVDRRLDSLETQTAQIELQLDTLIAGFNDKQFEIKHIFAKISKELSNDYAETDRAVRQHIGHSRQLVAQLTDQHYEQRRASDARISHFVQEKCATIRDLVQRQAKQRQSSLKQVGESLERDLSEIRQRLQQQSRTREQRVESIHQQFLQQYQRMRGEFRELSQKYSSGETEFYKMLGQVVKKVKVEVSESCKARQEMQDNILGLIEKICDKAMEQATQ